jgi:hypothetical protein
MYVCLCAQAYSDSAMYAHLDRNATFALGPTYEVVDNRASTIGRTYEGEESLGFDDQFSGTAQYELVRFVLSSSLCLALVSPDELSAPSPGIISNQHSMPPLSYSICTFLLRPRLWRPANSRCQVGRLQSRPWSSDMNTTTWTWRSRLRLIWEMKRQLTLDTSNWKTAVVSGSVHRSTSPRPR